MNVATCELYIPLNVAVLFVGVVFNVSIGVQVTVTFSLKVMKILITCPTVYDQSAIE